MDASKKAKRRMRKATPGRARCNKQVSEMMTETGAPILSSYSRLVCYTLSFMSGTSAGKVPDTEVILICLFHIEYTRFIGTSDERSPRWQLANEQRNRHLGPRRNPHKPQSE
jgi:hypothetical protein